MYKILSILALLATITFTSNAQTSGSGWNAARKQAHTELAKNSSRLDVEIIEKTRQEEIISKENANTSIALSKESGNLIDDLLKESASHLGKRYVWGSKGPNTFDCSGFTGYVYKQFGFKIGACSRDQYKTGTSVDIKSLRKGDLVFFTSRRSGSNVGHVGIVWEADNANGTFKFIHASTKGGIKISDFEGYYVKRYVGAKRVIE